MVNTLLVSPIAALMATFKTPGVYTQELNAFPNSLVSVATDIPAFIGYTPASVYNGKSLLMTPVLVQSWLEFKRYFGDPSGDKQPATFYLSKASTATGDGEFHLIDGEIYTVEPDPGTVYYLYNSVKMFFANGGSHAYIVAAGTYGPATKSALRPGETLVNPNVRLTELQSALKALEQQPDVTMYVAPDATLLPDADYYVFLQNMLAQCSDMQTAVAILDIKESPPAIRQNWKTDVENFRNHIGSQGLSYGAAYFPFLKTNAVALEELNFSNLNGGDAAALSDILKLSGTLAAGNVASFVKAIKSGDAEKTKKIQQDSAVGNSIYKQVLPIIRDKINILPPSGAVAGVFCLVDQTRGVWKAPANVSLGAVTNVTISLNVNDTSDLTIDALSGKSINPIRPFIGQGVLVWGARTLDGNSQDYRYINVRRTVNMVEQSIRLGMQAYVLEPNTAATWISLKSVIENFLTTLWRQGALAGATPDDAFSVQVGLGITMTPQDILDGKLNVTVLLALVRPAEFIVLTFSMKLQQT